ncbi:MAG: T9SS type A sorting domain-containing protein [Ignavibacteriales bacterium]|nr:T9SS type A sorting domain-containing protein [Ignavibacteriales bacterium]
MQKIYIFYLSFILTILFTTLALSQTIVFQDNFDTYTAGQQIACQSAGIWQTWTNNPCSATEDAYISNVYSFSGTNSILIKQNNDVVRDHGLLLNGVAEINFQVFIPAGKAGYFNTLANFAPPTYVWAMQVFFNSPGTGTLDAAGANAAAFSYPQNMWFPVKVVADLVADRGEFWINGSLIHSWQYSKGTFGSPTIAMSLDGTDFYGYTINDEMYIDDYNIVYTPIASNKISSTTTGGNWSSGSTWVGESIPDQNRDVEIVAGATVTLTANTNRNGRTIVNGNLDCGIFNITGTGHFVLSAYATLRTASSAGINSTGALGNIQVTGSRTFNQYANYVYNGTNTQVTGDGLPQSVKSLSINNSTGVTLINNTSVFGTLNLNNGNLFTNSNILSLGTSVTNLGVLNSSFGSVVGNFNRWISNSSSILFPVGTSPTKYTPVTLGNVVGSGTFSVSAIAGIHPTILNPNFLQMYWKLTSFGITSTDITFNYLDSDVVGDENQYSLFKYDGNWLPYSPITLNTTANTVTIVGVSSFSDWTLGIDDPLPVELSLFSATTIGSTVKLSWQTATEINNYGFDVERSAVKGNWEKIGFVNGNGNSNSAKNYSFIDDKISAGKYSYRLKQIDNDGQFEYSKIIEVDFNCVNKFELSQNFPNPFNPTTTINFNLPQAGMVRLTLYNILGQEIRKLVNEYSEAGTHTVNFNANDLNSGMYIYKIEANGLTQTRKMTLAK